ncbi:MAG TPA: cupin domain-containing protein [Candidatus Acidoferrales bacterium]|jgi:quercetin dioxygenase-like cupin family protein|nr:cupin domain-containing protein [Candidatus Acidoferrales bacterium]
MGPIRWEEIPKEKISEGVERQVIWGDKSTLARFHFAKGVHIPPHKHEGEQQTYVLEGSMRINAAGRDFELRAGEVLVIPTWLEHEVWFLENCVVLDFFSPPREDWKQGREAYLKGV